MTKMTLGTHPYLLGFDRLERLVDRAARSEGGYPPYDIEKTSENSFRITLAVAGFSPDELGLVVENRELIVRGGKASDDAEGREFLHRGIAARAFQRTFLLADGVEVTKADMKNGLLHIDLHRAEQKPQVQKIEIRKG